MIERTTFGDVQRLRMGPWQSRLFGYDVSAYVFRGILIDAGPWRARHELLNALQESPVRGCIVTHWHEDHAGNVPAFAAEKIPMWMAAETEQTLRAPFSPLLYRRFTWGRSPRLSGSVTPFDPGPLKAIHTPGHSSDHHAVWDAESRTLFSADLWLGVKVRAVNEKENPYAHIASLERAIALAPLRMFDAHRGLIENPVEALSAKLAWLRETVRVVEEFLDRGDSEETILRDVLGGEEAIGRLSGGEYARANFARAVKRSRQKP
jgi:glyoxylase-like metal-dependent hydrolase (beta-lactamase superfamily II)